MQCFKNKTIVSLFFLSAFLLLRVADAHAFSHFSDDEDDTYCEFCEIITASQELTPFTGQASFETANNKAIFVEPNQWDTGYNVPLHCIVCPFFFHNKPPPRVSVLC